MRIAYIPSENVLPRTRVPRSPTAPQRFNRIYTISLAERAVRISQRNRKKEAKKKKKIRSRETICIVYTPSVVSLYYKGYFYKFYVYRKYSKLNDNKTFKCFWLFIVTLLIFNRSQCPHCFLLQINNLTDKNSKIKIKQFVEVPFLKNYLWKP